MTRRGVAAGAWGAVAALGVSSVLFAAILLARRIYDLERRVSTLEAKPCLLSGAHTRCER